MGVFRRRNVRPDGVRRGRRRPRVRLPSRAEDAARDPPTCTVPRPPGTAGGTGTRSERGSAFGVSPRRIWGVSRSRGSRLGTTDSRAFVYGCCGFATTSRAGPCSTIRPRYITAIRSANLRRGRQVVGDHEDPEAAPAQLVQQRQDPGPDRDVEHRHRLVGHQQPGSSTSAAGDRHPLALPARQLVRVAVHVSSAGARPDARPARPGPLARRSLASRAHGRAAAPPRSRRTRNRGSSDSYGSW